MSSSWSTPSPFIVTFVPAPKVISLGSVPVATTRNVTLLLGYEIWSRGSTRMAGYPASVVNEALAEPTVSSGLPEGRKMEMPSWWKNQRLRETEKVNEAMSDRPGDGIGPSN